MSACISALECSVSCTLSATRLKCDAQNNTTTPSRNLFFNVQANVQRADNVFLLPKTATPGDMAVDYFGWPSAWFYPGDLTKKAPRIVHGATQSGSGEVTINFQFMVVPGPAVNSVQILPPNLANTLRANPAEANPAFGSGAPTDPATDWFIRNRWHELTYYVVSNPALPGTSAVCVAGTNCLRVGFPNGSIQTNAELALILMGRAYCAGVACQDRTLAGGGGVDKYLECGNQTPPPRDLQHRAGRRDCNDRIASRDR